MHPPISRLSQYHRQRHTWPSEIPTVRSICSQLRKKRRCCHSMASRVSQWNGQTRLSHCQRSIGQTRRRLFVFQRLFTSSCSVRPLNSVGMPHYNNLLLSSWSTDFIPTPMYFPPPPKIPQQVLSAIKVNDSIAYATLPKDLRGRRNVVPTAPRKTGGRFRSGKRYNDVGLPSLTQWLAHI